MNHEYILVELLEDYSVDDTFTQWPLHITLIPWCVPTDLQKFIDEVKRVSTAHQQIHSTVGEQRIWGSNTVNVVERTPELHGLHSELLFLVKTYGRLTVNEQYTGENYTPHVTHQGTLSAEMNSTLTIRAVYLVEKLPNVREKTIIGKFSLRAKND